MSNNRSEDRELTKAEVAQLLPAGIPHVSAYGAVGEAVALKASQVLPAGNRTTKPPTS